MAKYKSALIAFVAALLSGVFVYVTLSSPFQTALENDLLTGVDMGVLQSAASKIDRSTLSPHGQDAVFDPSHQEALIRILTTPCVENGQKPLTTKSFLKLKNGKITSASGQELTIVLDANNDGQCLVEGLGQVSSKQGAIVFYKEAGLYMLAN